MYYNSRKLGEASGCGDAESTGSKSGVVVMRLVAFVPVDLHSRGVGELWFALCSG